MIFGVDPIYWICLGFVGMLAFVTVMFLKMVETIKILKEIRDAKTLAVQNTGPLVTITTTDPLMAAFGQGRREPLPVERTTQPGIQSIDPLGDTATMPRV